MLNRFIKYTKIGKKTLFKHKEVIKLRYKQYESTTEFYQATYSILLKDEAQNSIPLGNVILGNSGGEPEGWRNPVNWYMATVSDESNQVLLVAIMTPPFNITLYETDNIPNDEALDCFCENLCAENIEVPGVTSTNELAKRFANKYTSIKKMKYEVHMNMRVYTLEEVNKSIPLVGVLRKASMNDIYFLPYWINLFSVECKIIGQTLDEALVLVKRAIEKEILWVLEDNGLPVAITGIVREIVNGCTIGMVYTPPYYRGKGYASSSVAQVTQIALDRGCKYVTLNTDLDNPTSNSIYQKIGYNPICDCNELRFITEK